MIRKQQAAKAAAPAAVETASAAPAAVPPTVVAATEPTAPVEAPKPIPTTGPDGKPLSKLDLIRMQGAAKKK